MKNTEDAILRYRTVDDVYKMMKERRELLAQSIIEYMSRNEIDAINGVDRLSIDFRLVKIDSYTWKYSQKTEEQIKRIKIYAQEHNQATKKPYSYLRIIEVGKL